MKVAIIEPIGGKGGMELYDSGLCNAIISTGCTPILYTSNNSEMDTLLGNEKFDIFIVYKNIYGKKNSVIRGFNYIKGTLKALLDCKRKRIRLAHFHIFHFNYLEYINLLLFKISGVKTVVTIHDVESFDKKIENVLQEKYKKFETVSDAFFVHSHYASKVLSFYFTDSAMNKTAVVLPLDFDTVYKKEMSSEEARRHLGLSQNIKIVLFFGQIKAVKGLEVLLKSFALLNSNNVMLLIVGRPWKTEGDIYKNMAEKLNIDRIDFRMHFIENRDVPKYFYASDIVVLPYKRVYNSSVMQRALDYGTPLIVSDLEPLTEIVKDGYNGLVFESENAEHLRDKLKTLIENPDLCNLLKKNQKRTVQFYYSPRKIGNQIVDVYRSVLNNE